MKIDTHTTNPAAVLRDCNGLAVIGRGRNDLMGIRNVEGDDGNTGGDNGAAGGDTGQNGASGTGDSNAAGGDNPTARTTDAEAPFGRNKEGKPFTAAESTAFVNGLRTEAQKNREAKEAAEQKASDTEAQIARVLAAVGLGTDGKPLPKDPAELEQAVSKTTAELNETRQDNIVLRLAPGLDADPDKLMDRVKFVTALRKLDATDREGIAELVTKTVNEDPSLKANATGSSSGGQGHSGNTSSTSRKSMHDAIQARVGTKK